MQKKVVRIFRPSTSRRRVTGRRPFAINFPSTAPVACICARTDIPNIAKFMDFLITLNDYVC